MKLHAVAVFLGVSLCSAGDRIATLGDPVPSSNGALIGGVLKNLTDEPIYTSLSSGIILQHKINGEWINTPHPTLLRLVGHVGTDQWTRIEVGASHEVGVEGRDYQPFVHEQYRLKVILIDPKTGKPTGSVLSRAVTLNFESRVQE